jgi:hypothetical protein
VGSLESSLISHRVEFFESKDYLGDRFGRDSLLKLNDISPSNVYS